MLRRIGVIVMAVLVLLDVVQAEEGFTTIHTDNQKIGSAVSAYWRSQVARDAAARVDGFMAIHMDNQKTGSAVAAYWRTLARPGD